MGSGAVGEEKTHLNLWGPKLQLIQRVF